MNITQDKIEHWAFGFVLTLFWIIHPALIFTGIAFGVGKELYDYKYGTGWNGKDLVATLLGVWTAMLFLVAVII